MIVQFKNREAEYMAWVLANPAGYVVNARGYSSEISPQYPMVHHAACGHISRLKNYTTGSYYKVCSDSFEELERWSLTEYKKSLTQCLDCMTPLSGYWWVNHKQTWKAELEGGYIWSPKKNKNGARNQTYINLTLVRPGDMVVSYAGAKVCAIGVATASFREQPKPQHFGQVGANWADVGWLVPVEWTVLADPVSPKTHLDSIAELLPKKHSPLQMATGKGNQSCYLASISSELGQLILDLAGEQCASFVFERSECLKAGQGTISGSRSGRLPVGELRKVTALEVWQAVQDLADGACPQGFAPSTDYDLLTDEGLRFAPKAVFGLAATYALGFPVQPKHFTAGVGSPCFEILQDCGYQIVPKGENPPAADPAYLTRNNYGQRVEKGLFPT